MLCWGRNSPGVSAASQKTLFIVSGSQSNLILGEVDQMLFFWEIFLRLDESHSFWTLDKGPEHPNQAFNRLKAFRTNKKHSLLTYSKEEV